MSKNDNKQELQSDEVVKKVSILPEKRSNNNNMLPMVTVFLLLVISGLTATGVYEYRKLKTENEKNITDLTQKMNSLANYVDGRLNPISQNIQELQKSSINIENEKNMKMATDVAIATLESKLAQMKASLATELEEKISKNIVVPKSETIIKKEESHLAQETLLASGALVVRDLAELGDDFRYECEVMQILAQGNKLAQNYTAALRIYAINGVRGKNRLIKDFNKIYVNLGDTKIKPENALAKNYAEMDWAEKIIYYLRKYSILKRSTQKPQFKAKDDEVYRLVNEGDLHEALEAIKNSEKYGKIDSAPLNEWIKNTEDYLSFRHIIDSLLMNSLANLRIKEMEH